MNNSNLLAQLQQVCDILQPFQFGVGGSCLLWQLGLEAAPKDIDIVCTEQDFASIAEVLSVSFSQQPMPAHPDYVSAHFSRFSQSGRYDIDLMAGIAGNHGGSISRWQFNPQRCHWQNGVCWMPPADWLQLYQLFDRPERVARLRQYLVQLRLSSLN